MQTQNLLFGCCSGFNGLNDQQGQIRSLIRSKITKEKKKNLGNLVHCHKSSLKTFKSMKNLHDFQNLNVCNSTMCRNDGQKLLKLSSVREIPVSCYVKKIEKFQSVCGNQLKRSVYSGHKQLNIPLSISSPKNKIKFSYNNQNNPERKSQGLPFVMKEKDEKSENSKYEIVNRKCKFSTPISCEIKNNQKKEQQIKLMESKKSIEWTGSEKGSVMSLVQSRITIKSSKQVDELQDMKMDESCIIVDVFHASESQIKKWGTNMI